jgi:vacuolar iron transporter family protein
MSHAFVGRHRRRARRQRRAGQARMTSGGELRELADIYERRGVPADLALQVAAALSSGGALAAHARDELGLDEQRGARPLQAAWTSAVSFSAGAILPLGAIGVSPPSVRVVICIAVTLIALVVLGDTGARLGGAPRLRATWRVLVWGAAAMALTAGIGALVGTTTG